MLKRLSILLLAVILAVPAMAQSGDCCECMFAPRAGQWQFNLVTGESGYLNDYDGLFYLLDQKASSTVGIGIGDNAYISDDLSKAVFNIGSFNVNSLTNIAGLQAQYFITNHIDINLMGMNRKKAVAIAFGVTMALGIFCSLSQGALSSLKLFGLSIFDFFNFLSSNVLMTGGGLLLVIFIGWKLGKDAFCDEMTSGGKIRKKKWLLDWYFFAIKYLCPAAITVIFISNLLVK